MAENQNSELDPTELIGLVEGTVSELKDYVRENDFSDDQLEQILSAESSSKDRKTAKKFLKKRIDSEDIEQNTSSKKDSKEEEQNERSDKVRVKESSLSREALLQMLGGTVEDVKAYVKENEPEDDELQSLLHAEKMVKDRKTVVKFLKSYSKKKELEEDFHKAETDLKELKEDLETIEESVLEEDVELELDEFPDTKDNEESPEEETKNSKEDDGSEDSEAEETGDGEDSEEKDEDESESEESDEAESEEDEDASEDEDEEAESEEETEDEDTEDSDDLTEMEKKKQVLENLEMDLSEEELQQISLEELEKLKEEKEKREQLINRLSVKFDREQLEKVTTKDLEKLADEVGDLDEDISKQEAQRQEEAAKKQKKKDEAEMKKEAQHDLEMMMGAVKNEETEDEDSKPGAVDQLKQLPNKFKGILSRGGDKDEEDQSTGFDRSKTVEVLESYSEAEDHEAAVKTAQVMKGYLEYALEIERELTYAELAEEMESRELDNENINTLIEFYRSMKIAVYTGDVETDNIDEVIEASKSVVKELG